jgi:hypothetical protein
VYTPSMMGPHTLALRGIGATQWDLSWLLTAHDRKVLAEGKSPLGSWHPEPVPMPWSNKDDVLCRGQALREELQIEEFLGEPGASAPGETCQR